MILHSPVSFPGMTRRYDSIAVENKTIKTQPHMEWAVRGRWRGIEPTRRHDALPRGLLEGTRAREDVHVRREQKVFMLRRG